MIHTGDIVILIYGKKYPGMPYHKRHVRVLVIATKRPKNVLVMLKGGKLVTVPFGNLREGYESK